MRTVMPNAIFEFSQSILKLNKEKKYAEALQLFKENKINFTNNEIKQNAFLISAIVSALRHTNNIEQAFKFLEIYNVEINSNSPEIILSAYGWLLYDKYKSENKITEHSDVEIENYQDDEISSHDFTGDTKSGIVTLIEEFLRMLVLNVNDRSYLLLSKLFSVVVKTEKKKNNINWRLISDLCDVVPPSLLSIECETIDVERKGKKVTMELASDKENWYAYKTKALMKLGKFQECFEQSTTALETFQKFHYSNDVWFARRIALAKMQLGDSESTISELLQILNKKKEWFIEKELAELYKEKGDVKNAFKYAINAINNFGDLEYKVDLLFLLGELFLQQHDETLAFKHFSLARLIRLKKEWSIPAKLASAIDSINKQAIQEDDMPSLRTELKKYWSTLSPKQNLKKNYFPSDRLKGTIDKILHKNERGTDGFIKCTDNKRIYFMLPQQDELSNKIDVGSNIEFQVSKSADGKEKAIKLSL
jgi:tetratricopeptide (TPR) repeat protein